MTMMNESGTYDFFYIMNNHTTSYPTIPNFNMKTTILLLVATASSSVSAFNAFTPMLNKSPPVKSVESKMPMFEYLKFDKKPTFNVLAKTQQYVSTQTAGTTMSEEWYAPDYILRGP